MPPLAHHLMLRLRDDRVIAPTTAARRTLAGVVLVLGLGREPGLLAFSGADTHVHLLVACDRAASGQLARRAEISLTRRLAPGVGFSRAHILPVEGQRHLQNTFAYVLRQEERHGLPKDPCFDASSLPDLLGLRVTGAFMATSVRALLPQVGRAELLGWLGADLEQPAGSFDLLPDAAAAAVCLPALVGHSRAAREARRAAVQLVGRELSTRELSSLLGVGERTVKRLRTSHAVGRAGAGRRPAAPPAACACLRCER